MSKETLPAYGGQAVIEGVMMRGARAVAIAMRSPDGEIVTHTEPLTGIYISKLRKVPFLRGLLLLWDALGLGMRALTISANLQSGEDEQLEGFPLFLTLVTSLAFAIALFFLLPATAGHFFERTLEVSPWVGNLFEGLVRLAILIGYIWAIGLTKDIRRVFGYHGAEHKTINAFEARTELTPEQVAKYSVEHPRCGTAFLLNLVVLSILVFTMIGPIDSLWLRLGVRVLLIPALAGLAYEYLRWTANHLDSPLVRWMIKPNLALQRLTTREPDKEMLEVGITAFKTMRKLEEEFAEG